MTRLSWAVNTSAKPSSGRYAAAANDDGRFAMPIQPNEPSCQAISIHVSIISANDGSTPPASTGLNADISPVAHIASTIAGVSVRIRSDSAASARHQLAHPARQPDNPVGRFGYRRHPLDPSCVAGPSSVARTRPVDTRHGMPDGPACRSSCAGSCLPRRGAHRQR